MKYRKKDILITAMKLTRSTANHVVEFIGNDNLKDYSFGAFLDIPCYVLIKTSEGTRLGSEGDYIIKGILGEFYPCKSDVFVQNYELVESK